MSDFYKTIKANGTLSFLERVEYVPPVYIGMPKVTAALNDILLNDYEVRIYGDYDVDGLMCARAIARMFDLLGYEHYSISEYRQRTHEFDKVAAYKSVQQSCDYMIVCDTGSSLKDREVIKYLINHGIKVIILDHHQTSLSYEDYPDEVAIINTTIENRTRSGEDILKLSAGALCYTVAREYLTLNGIEDDSISAYGTISLYADCMDMSSRLNRAIYYRSKDLLTQELPRDVLYFMNQYSSFNARYIEYWFSPRVNAIFRSENLELLNLLFFNDNLSMQLEQALIEKIEEIYTSVRAMVYQVTDIIECIELDNFVLADLGSVQEHIDVEQNKLYNYTGLVANQLSSRFGKTVVTYCLHNNVYKGSVRDLYSRNYLSLFQTFCDAGGHNSAFGLYVTAFGFNKFIDSIKKLDAEFAVIGIENAPIIVDYTQNAPDAVLIEDMALYNEFAGKGTPIALLRKQIVGAMQERHTKYGYRYIWGNYMVQSDHALTFGSHVLIKPFFSHTTKLLVQ